MTSRSYEPLPGQLETIAKEVVDAALQVHRELGPGLLESVYGTCLAHEFSLRKISFQKELELPIIYKNVCLNAGLRLDFLVDDSIILELKSVEKMTALHEAQLLTYLKLTGKRIGFLLNFNVPLMKDGTKRMVL